MQSKASDVGQVPLHELLAEVLAGDLTDGRFEVQYQPIVRLAGGATVVVEAVACWQHPRVGQAAPVQFMAAAERAGLSAVLDDYVLRDGCKIGQGKLYGPALRLQRVGKAGKAKIAR